MTWRLLLPACVLTLLLAACSVPTPRPAAPAPAPVPVTRIPAPMAVTAPPPISPVEISTPPDIWQELRDSFAMHDCVAPAVRRAKRETRNRRGFEKHMQRLLPLIDYVRRVAAEHSVAGEFVLLPWVESHFRQTPPRRHRPAGMWQIMPITARALDLETSRRYDGRLDTVASTRAVMELLSAYYRTWHDWRLADMAFNTGEYRLRRILKAHGMPPATPVIPKLPVSRITRKHLTKLLAIACIIRDPDRFHVQLPVPDPNRLLQAVQLSAPASLHQVARLSGLPYKQLRELNAGYRQAHVSSGTPMQLLLPMTAATTLREAMAAGLLESDTAGLTATGPDGETTYTVVSGDSLWSISRRFHVQVEQLRQWNGLDGSMLRPGQVLRLAPPPSG